MQIDETAAPTEPADHGYAADEATIGPAQEPDATGAAEASEPLVSSEIATRPDDIPEKFWDQEAGAIRTDALLQSYRELERRLSRSVPRPDGEDDVEGIAKLLGLLGRPETADAYQISAPHPLVTPDPELNELLHSAGFTQRQAQLIYDLAAERLLPVLDEATAELEATRQIDRLERHFGGPDGWRTTAAQIKAYAEANLPKELQSALAASYEGILALHEMMRKAEPDIVGQAGSGPPAVTEDSLRELIRDPRYWRDRDPEIVQRVTAGYRNLYPG